MCMSSVWKLNVGWNLIGFAIPPGGAAFACTICLVWFGGRYKRAMEVTHNLVQQHCSERKVWLRRMSETEDRQKCTKIVKSPTCRQRLLEWLWLMLWLDNNVYNKMHISQHISEGTTTKTLLGNIGLTRYRSDIIVHCYSYYYIGQHNWRNQCSNTAIFNVAYDVFFCISNSGCRDCVHVTCATWNMHVY